MSRPGSYVSLRAEMDLIVAFSACPQDLVPVNGAACVPTDAHYRIDDAAPDAGYLSSRPIKPPQVPRSCFAVGRGKLCRLIVRRNCQSRAPLDVARVRLSDFCAQILPPSPLLGERGSSLPALFDNSCMKMR